MQERAAVRAQRAAERVGTATLGHLALGATRPSVSLAAATMKRAGLIDYQRGRLTIIDRAGLEDVACGCYVLITDEYERATGARLRPGVADVRPSGPARLDAE